MVLIKIIWWCHDARLPVSPLMARDLVPGGGQALHLHRWDHGEFWLLLAPSLLKLTIVDKKSPRMTLLPVGEQYGVLRGAGRGARGGGPGQWRHGALLQLPRHHHHPHQPHTLQAEWVPPYCHYYMIQWQHCSPQLPAQPRRLPAVLAVPLHPGRCSPLHTLQGGRRLHQVEIWDD